MLIKDLNVAEKIAFSGDILIAVPLRKIWKNNGKVAEFL